jgi:hypothetical protein
MSTGSVNVGSMISTELSDNPFSGTGVRIDMVRKIAGQNTIP